MKGRLIYNVIKFDKQYTKISNYWNGNGPIRDIKVDFVSIS